MGQVNFQMHQEQHHTETAKVDVNLEPGFRIAQRQEGQFFAGIVKREQQHHGEQSPAGQERIPRQPRAVMRVQPQRAGRGKEQGCEAGQGLAAETFHFWSQRVRESRLLRFRRVSAPWGQARWQAGPP